jgi:hypothetical protein
MAGRLACEATWCAYVGGLALGSHRLAGGLDAVAEMTPDGIKRILVPRHAWVAGAPGGCIDTASSCVAALYHCDEGDHCDEGEGGVKSVMPTAAGSGRVVVVMLASVTGRGPTKKDRS